MTRVHKGACFVGAGERVSWNSGTISFCSDVGVLSVAWVASGGVGETTSSRHSKAGRGLVSTTEGSVWVGEFGGFEVGIRGGVGGGAFFALWKAWMGKASKNSCATMRGILSGPSGMALTTPVQMMGMLPYLDML
ncbi:hypothetical protein HYQ46_007292 [Verticillium longisporum]|nr:hypothetical protein HYQ46_007292 [Verticillium longisporum]